MRRRRRPISRRPGDAEHRADDRLDALGDAGIAERHRAVEAVAVGQRDRRKAELRRLLGDRLGLHRPFEHGEGGENAKRNVGRRSRCDYGHRGLRSESRGAAAFPQLKLGRKCRRPGGRGSRTPAASSCRHRSTTSPHCRTCAVGLRLIVHPHQRILARPRRIRPNAGDRHASPSAKPPSKSARGTARIDPRLPPLLAGSDRRG